MWHPIVDGAEDDQRRTLTGVGFRVYGRRPLRLPQRMQTHHVCRALASWDQNTRSKFENPFLGGPGFDFVGAALAKNLRAIDVVIERNALAKRENEASSSNAMLTERVAHLESQSYVADVRTLTSEKSSEAEALHSEVASLRTQLAGTNRQSHGWRGRRSGTSSSSGTTKRPVAGEEAAGRSNDAEDGTMIEKRLEMARGVELEVDRSAHDGKEEERATARVVSHGPFPLYRRGGPQDGGRRHCRTKTQGARGDPSGRTGAGRPWGRPTGRNVGSSARITGRKRGR